MTVDHLKMLHTAGGKGKVLCLTEGRQREERVPFRLVCGVPGERSEKREWELSPVSSGIWDFLLLDKICGNVLRVLAPGCCRGRVATSLSSNVSAL